MKSEGRGIPRSIRERDLHGIESWLIETLRSYPHRNRIRTLVPIAHGAAAVLTVIVPKMCIYVYSGRLVIE